MDSTEIEHDILKESDNLAVGFLVDFDETLMEATLINFRQNRIKSEKPKYGLRSRNLVTC